MSEETITLSEYGKRVGFLLRERDELRTRAETAEAERDAMRAVVEAARVIQSALDECDGDTFEPWGAPSEPWYAGSNFYWRIEEETDARDDLRAALSTLQGEK